MIPNMTDLLAATRRSMPADNLKKFCEVNPEVRVPLAARIWDCCVAGWLRQASLFPEMLAVCEAILNIPPHVAGAVAEFGCWNGFSTACLSHVCNLMGRKLIVFDTFAGLPHGGVTNHISDTQQIVYQYGQYAGNIDAVKSVVTQHGEIEVCEFVMGRFSDTLPARKQDQYCCIFEDADLVESVRDVLDLAWPRLQHGCKFFCHEARDLQVVQLFFESGYWKVSHGTDAPGIAGSGIGLPLCFNEGDKSSSLLPLGSCLAYAIKR